MLSETHFCVKDNCSCRKKTKTLPGISSSDTLVTNQFFVTSCLTCLQDQTAAVKYYWGQNTSTNSYFLQAAEERKHHWQQCTLMLHCSTSEVQSPLIRNEKCNKAVPHVWTLSCHWARQPPVFFFAHNYVGLWWFCSSPSCNKYGLISSLLCKQKQDRSCLVSMKQSCSKNPVYFFTYAANI